MMWNSRSAPPPSFIDLASFWALSFAALLLAFQDTLGHSRSVIVAGINIMWGTPMFALYPREHLRNRAVAFALATIPICFVAGEQDKPGSSATYIAIYFGIYAVSRWIVGLWERRRSAQFSIARAPLEARDDRLLSFSDLWLPGIAIAVWWYAAEHRQVSFPGLGVYVLYPVFATIISYGWRRDAWRGLTAGLAVLPVCIWQLYRLGGIELVLRCLECFSSVAAILIAFRCLRPVRAYR